MLGLSGGFAYSESLVSWSLPDSRDDFGRLLTMGASRSSAVSHVTQPKDRHSARRVTVGNLLGCSRAQQRPVP